MTDQPPQDGSPDGTSEGVGSLAEEAEKLFGALSGWAGQAGDGVAGGVAAAAGQAAEAARGVADHVATGAPECQWCPVCRVVHAFRDTDPEVREHLATAAASFLQALAGVMATRPPADHGSRDDAGVEHIDVGGDWPTDDPDGGR